MKRMDGADGCADAVNGMRDCVAKCMGIEFMDALLALMRATRAKILALRFKIHAY